MSHARIARLADRGIVSLEGPDAEKLLQGLVTNDIAGLAPGEARHAALLTPQGKVLADFFVTVHEGALLLECPLSSVDDLVKRLTLYRLRAKVEIRPASAGFVVLALWGADHRSSGETSGTVAFADPRHPGLGRRILAEARFADDIAAATNGTPASADDYHAHRIALGVPEGGKDYAFADAFPHEAWMDKLHGVSFTKGCYVGQELVSRMEHRSTARKRIVPVNASEPPVPGTPVIAGEAEIGVIGSVAERRALAMLRLDRVAEIARAGGVLQAGGAKLTIDLPPWAAGA
jgi:hypothetical protein